MKYFVSFFVSLFFLLQSFTFAYADASASNPVTIDLDGSAGQTAPAGFSRVKLKTTHTCSEGNITIGWDRLGDSVHRFDRACVPLSGGEGVYSPTEGFDTGDYKILYKCGCGYPTDIPNPDKIVDGAFFTATAQTTQPNLTRDPGDIRQGDLGAKVVVDRCPADSPVHLHFSIDKPGGWFGFTNTTVYDVDLRTDAAGRAEYTRRSEGFTNGNYNVSVTCGGKTFTDDPEGTFPQGRFSVSRETLSPTQLPPPPFPNCASENNGQCVQVNTAIGRINTTDEGFIINIFLVILGLSGGVAILIIIYAGYLIMTSRGNAEQIQKGRELLTSALIGLLFIIFSFVILETLTIDILHIPGFRTFN